jgi:hypothetical protein
VAKSMFAMETEGSVLEEVIGVERGRSVRERSLFEVVDEAAGGSDCIGDVVESVGVPLLAVE